MREWLVSGAGLLYIFSIFQSTLIMMSAPMEWVIHEIAQFYLLIFLHLMHWILMSSLISDGHDINHDDSRIDFIPLAKAFIMTVSIILLEIIIVGDSRSSFKASMILSLSILLFISLVLLLDILRGFLT